MDQLAVNHVWLGVDSGGTRTVAVAVGLDGREMARRESGPGNPLAAGDDVVFASLRTAVDAVLDDIRPARPLAGPGLASARRRPPAHRL